ncbi:TolC family protein [Spirosoma utsteinense]|uniref:Outer membrane protein TolC n=1 Tax=Spirosoma utsteinense TaxID=2585773 RepID=A0ABR6W577_9BACT|nr:TolC family protein [Spirosoma utsteinense]MBC3784273.1 outer membrane protein TolC [Spirosoma utsteinense]MBC3790930.1 outer membrane protein TolC [Spirosoma utsteinense]
MILLVRHLYWIAFFLPTWLIAQPPTPVATIAPAVQSVILDEYIREGLANNLGLRQESLDISRVTESINQARSLFYPRIAFNPTYSLAAGGRRLEFPVGDLLNPAYRTLNQLTGSDRFPTNIENVNQQLAPNNFHDTKVSFQYTLFNTDIQYNYLIQKQLLSAQEARKRVIENELRYSIATAYFQYLQSLDAVQILENARLVLNELARLNEKLVSNNVATREVVSSARYEISKVAQQLATAGKNRETARAYLNFLINRDLTAAVAVDSSLTKILPEAPEQLSELQQIALRGRQELVQLGGSLQAAQTSVRLNEANATIPNLYLGGNAGFQGFGYTFRNQAYAIAQIGLQWDLFRGYEKRSKIQQAKIQTDALQTRIQDVQRQIQLQVLQAYYDLDAANESLAATQSGIVNADATFRVIDSKYRNGQALLIEFLRYQNDRLTAQLQHSLARTDVLVKRAALDRAVAVK